jgi:hypothetical protein
LKNAFQFTKSLSKTNFIFLKIHLLKHATYLDEKVYMKHQGLGANNNKLVDTGNGMGPGAKYFM